MRDSRVLAGPAWAAVDVAISDGAEALELVGVVADARSMARFIAGFFAAGGSR